QRGAAPDRQRPGRSDVAQQRLGGPHLRHRRDGVPDPQRGDLRRGVRAGGQHQPSPLLVASPPVASPPVGSAARVAAAVWGAAILGGLAIGALGPEAWRTAIAEHGPGCPFRAVTGVDCPFCGMTRATLALGGGDLRAALALHPLAPLVLLGTLALMAAVAF